MPAQALVPAAEYVRMSTEDQQNSIPIQKAAIQRYAAAHGYDVVKTYSDPGKSGVEIKHRPGIRQLLHDVVGGQSRFRVILVYDVSRWGRFQDTDESAHYEFLCRSAGVPIHYCAEQFENDGRMSNSILKALKRTMAAEYSRELAVKVSAGQRRIVAQGFRAGAGPGFGLRRMLVSADGRRMHILRFHESKYAMTDRVILVPGPRREVECIRTIFALAADARKSPLQIAEELNRRRVKCVGDKQWKESHIYRILKNEKYMGSNVWGKTECPFNTYKRRVPPEEWVIKRNAFVPLVTPEQFARVQKLMQERKTYPKKPDEYLFNRMRKVLAKEGKLTEKLLVKHGFFDYRTYVSRFGSVMRAYELIGYQPSAHAFASVDAFNKMKRLRADLLTQLKVLFPSRVRITRLPGQTQRQVVEVDNCMLVAIHICRPTRSTVSNAPRWLLLGQPKESSLPGLICIPDDSLSVLSSFYLVPEFGKLIRRYKVLGEGHSWLASGKRLDSLLQFCDFAKEVRSNWTMERDVTTIGDVVLTGRTSTVTVAGKDFMLPGIEAAIFKLLVNNTGVAVSRENLCQAALIASREKLKRFVDPKEVFLSNHVSTLRRRLGPLRKRIVTVKGEGYKYQTIR
jgi:DNA invertase Pin-like site-specific DNA recombinase/DNA-binding winged helix-turn-helix (wHTH) protein